MAISRRAILAAILEESRQRRGPVPVRLVAIAVNASGKAAQLDVETKLISLRTEGYIAAHQDLRGSGLVVTPKGSMFLEGKLPEETPVPAPEPAPAPAPPAEPEPQAAETTPEPEAVEAPPASEAAAIVCSPANLAPRHELYELLCDLAGLVSEQLAAAIDSGNHSRALELNDLGKRILQETGGPRR